jgi:hypothetical protein
MRRITIIRVRNASIQLGLAMAAITLVPSIAGAAFRDSARSIRVVGSGVRTPSTSKDVPFTFAFNATARPDSNGSYGTFSGSYPHDPFFRNGASAAGKFASFSGSLKCVRVDGNHATIGGIITAGYGYDGTYSGHQRKLKGDWFITTVRDPTRAGSADTMGYVDWGSARYFGDPKNFNGHRFGSFKSLCDNPTPDLGNSQFTLKSGDIRIGR